MSADLQSGHIPHDLPRCDLTDLPRLICACPDHFAWAFDEDDLEPAEIAYLQGKVVLPTIPEYRDYHLLRVDYQSREWKYLGLKHVPDLIVCSHQPDDTHLCFPCAVAFRHLLLDVPGLIADLQVAFIKQTVFAERGTLEQPYPEEEDRPDFAGPWTEEAGIHWNPAASKALDRLTQALAGPPETAARLLLSDWRTTLRRPDLASLAAAVSSAVRYAFRVIERPPTPMFYGQCPDCGKDIHQERVDPHDPEGRVHCTDCGYLATVQDHQRAQLDLGENRWYTERETLRVLEQGGEPVSRSEFAGLVKHQGLSRDKGVRMRWSGNQLEKATVDVYRLGEVRELMDDVRQEREFWSTERVAMMLGITSGGVRKLVERDQLAPVRRNAVPLRFHPDHVDEFMRQRDHKVG